MKKEFDDIVFNFFDTETTGVGSGDQILQFGSIRADSELLDFIDKNNIFCKIRPDVIPHPMATLTHKISLKTLNEKGLDEIEFARKINELMTERSFTCHLGYNTLRFDDQKIRELFFRNLIDPYSREWRNSNSRSDIFSLVKMINVIKPSVINWFYDDDGKKSLRLEHLAKVNNIKQTNAHDALSDVEATIGLAKLIKDNAPDIYNFFFKLRKKEFVAKYCCPMGSPFLYVGKGAEYEYNYATVLLPLAINHKNKNSVFCYDLRYDTSLLYGDYETVNKRLYSRRDNPELDRFPIMEVAINQSPIVCPLSKITDEVFERVRLDRNEVLERANSILNSESGLESPQSEIEKINEFIDIILKNSYVNKDDDYYARIYNRFYSNNERSLLDGMHLGNVDRWLNTALLTGSNDIYNLTLRAVGNYNKNLLPDNLHGKCNPRNDYEEWMVSRWSDKSGLYGLTVDDFFSECKKVRGEMDLSDSEKTLLCELEDYIFEMSKTYNKNHNNDYLAFRLSSHDDCYNDSARLSNKKTDKKITKMIDVIDIDVEPDF